MFSNPDTHLHSTFSDGSDTPEELLKNVKSAGVDFFSLTDHDTFLGCTELRKHLKDGDPYFLDGIELSCKDEIGSYHILGYGFDMNKKPLIEATEITQNARREKATNRLRFLYEEYGFEFSDEDVAALLKHENPGKPHFVNLMMEKGYITSTRAGFTLLENYHGHERRLSPKEAIDAILFSDGIPVLAHGILGAGKENLTMSQIDERLARLKQCGLMGAECYYSTFTEDQKQIMLSLAKKYNLLITAGSDYHGTNKKIPIGSTNHLSPADMRRFYRTIEMLKG